MRNNLDTLYLRWPCVLLSCKFLSGICMWIIHVETFVSIHNIPVSPEGIQHKASDYNVHLKICHVWCTWCCGTRQSICSIIQNNCSNILKAVHVTVGSIMERQLCKEYGGKRPWWDGVGGSVYGRNEPLNLLCKLYASEREHLDSIHFCSFSFYYSSTTRSWRYCDLGLFVCLSLGVGIHLSIAKNFSFFSKNKLLNVLFIWTYPCDHQMNWLHFGIDQIWSKYILRIFEAYRLETRTRLVVEASLSSCT